MHIFLEALEGTDNRDIMTFGEPYSFEQIDMTSFIEELLHLHLSKKINVMVLHMSHNCGVILKIDDTHPDKIKCQRTAFIANYLKDILYE